MNQEYKLKIDKIKAFEKENQKQYSDLRTLTINKLQASGEYNFLLTSFIVSKKDFFIRGFEYQEEISELITSQFFNTRSYLKFACNEEIADQVWTEHLKPVNKYLETILKGGFEALNDVKEKVIGKVDEIQVEFEEVCEKYYEDFLELVRNNLASDYLPKVLTTYLTLFNETSDHEYLFKKLENDEYVFIQEMSNKSANLLKHSFEQFYSVFAIDLDKARMSSQTKKKAAFSDFDEENLVFDTNFDDEQQALMMLGLTSPVTIKEIKQAYKKLAKQYHPDLNKDNPIAEKKMQMITTAYNFLKNKW